MLRTGWARSARGRRGASARDRGARGRGRGRLRRVAPGSTPGDVVCATELRRAEAPIRSACRPRRALARRCATPRPPRPHRAAPLDRAPDGPPSARAAATGALAVDMESAWLAEAAGGRPLAVVRVVADAAGRARSSTRGCSSHGSRALAALRRVSDGACRVGRAGRPACRRSRTPTRADSGRDERPASPGASRSAATCCGSGCAATTSSRCSSSSSRSSSATSRARSAGRSSTRSTSSRSACRSTRRSRRSRSRARRWSRSPAASRSSTPRSHVIARELVKRKKFVYLCTNGILMKKKLDLFEPSPYFAWVVHLDGLRERHDQFVEREGVFDKAVEAIREAQAPRLPRQHEHDLLHDRHAEDRARRARLPERRAEGRPDDDLARLRLREGARPGALPRRRRRRASSSARRSRTARASAGG